jgi:hypothetical protein
MHTHTHTHSYIPTQGGGERARERYTQTDAEGGDGKKRRGQVGEEKAANAIGADDRHHWGRARIQGASAVTAEKLPSVYLWGVWLAVGVMTGVWVWGYRTKKSGINCCPSEHEMHCPASGTQVIAVITITVIIIIIIIIMIVLGISVIIS